MSESQSIEQTRMTFQAKLQANMKPALEASLARLAEIKAGLSEANSASRVLETYLDLVPSLGESWDTLAESARRCTPGGSRVTEQAAAQGLVSEADSSVVPFKADDDASSTMLGQLGDGEAVRVVVSAGMGIFVEATAAEALELLGVKVRRLLEREERERGMVDKLERDIAAVEQGLSRLSQLQDDDDDNGEEAGGQRQPQTASSSSRSVLSSRNR